MSFSDTRLPSHMVASSLIRQCSVAAIPAYVRHKGDQERGQIFLVFSPMDGLAEILERSTSFDGGIIWRVRASGLTDQAVAEQVARILRLDTEAIILDIEASADALTLDAPVERN